MEGENQKKRKSLYICFDFLDPPSGIQDFLKILFGLVTMLSTDFYIPFGAFWGPPANMVYQLLAPKVEKQTF